MCSVGQESKHISACSSASGFLINIHQGFIWAWDCIWNLTQGEHISKPMWMLAVPSSLYNIRLEGFGPLMSVGWKLPSVLCHVALSRWQSTMSRAARRNINIQGLLTKGKLLSNGASSWEWRTTTSPVLWKTNHWLFSYSSDGGSMPSQTHQEVGISGAILESVYGHIHLWRT